jgi:hypothetical protein
MQIMGHCSWETARMVVRTNQTKGSEKLEPRGCVHKRRLSFFESLSTARFDESQLKFRNLRVASTHKLAQSKTLFFQCRFLSYRQLASGDINSNSGQSGDIPADMCLHSYHLYGVDETIRLSAYWSFAMKQIPTMQIVESFE